MPQTNYSPILIYGSTTAGNTPSASNLNTSASGVELAINATDGKLFYKDNAGVVQTIATKSGAAGTFSSVTITGGSINGTTIGATTASTGAFTTLSASSTVSGTGFSTYLASPPAIGGTTPAAGSFTTLSASSTTTLSGGTANGVAYLNGSKVVTTGSALTFDGTNLGVGASSPNTLLDVRGANGVGIRFLETSTGNTNRVQLGTGSGFGYIDATAGSGSTALAFQVASTEQMRLTSTGLGIGTSSPANPLNIVKDNTAFRGQLSLQTVSASNFAQLTFYDQTTLSAQIYQAYGSDKAINIVNPLAHGIAFWTTNTERMRLDSSGNLGIGTSSPGTKLEVSVADASVATRWNAATGRLRLRPYVDATSGATFESTNTAESSYLPLSLFGSSVRLGNGAQVIIDSSGNLGIGTSSPAAKLDVLGSSGDQIRVRTAGTEYYRFGRNSSTGYMDFYGSQSGYQGYTFGGIDGTWMTINSSGNLGLGVTPSGWQSDSRALDIGAYTSFSNVLGYQAVVANNAYYNSGYKYRTSGYVASAFVQASGAFGWLTTSTSGTAGNAITFTQAMTLDASGNLGVGTTSPATYGSRTNLYVAGSLGGALILGEPAKTFQGVVLGDYNNGRMDVGTITNHALRFLVNNTERAQIDTNGNLLVGRTGLINQERLGVTTATDVACSTNRASSSSYYPWVFYSNSNVVGYIQSTSTTTTYATSSDYRLKEDIQPMTGALAKVAALKPCTYKWKADGSDGEGFIAHELQAVVPQCVTGEKDAVDEEGKPVYQGIDTSFLVATLTAALQEAVVEINQLKADVAALKAK